MRASLVFLVIAALPAVGCVGWARGSLGGAMPTSGRSENAGAVVGVDVSGSPRPHSLLNRSEQRWPLGIHNSVEASIGSQYKTVWWGTGIMATWEPHPIAGYVVAGTQAHVDSVDGKFSFGNLNPYGEIGVVAPFSATPDAKLLSTFSLETVALYSYFAPVDQRLQLLWIVKYGLAYEIQ